jgi:hypothetical protein
MNKIMDYLTKLVSDDSYRYPGLVKRNLISGNLPDPILWANGVLFYDVPSETHNLNLKNL